MSGGTFPADLCRFCRRERKGQPFLPQEGRKSIRMRQSSDCPGRMLLIRIYRRDSTNLCYLQPRLSWRSNSQWKQEGMHFEFALFVDWYFDLWGYTEKFSQMNDSSNRSWSLFSSFERPRPREAPSDYPAIIQCPWISTWSLFSSFRIRGFSENYYSEKVIANDSSISWDPHDLEKHQVTIQVGTPLNAA